MPSLLNIILGITDKLELELRDTERACCVGEICGIDLIRYVDRELGNYKYFRRSNGTDHVIVCSDWRCPFLMEKDYNNYRNTNSDGARIRTMLKTPQYSPDLIENLNRCNSISFEENSMRDDRCRIAKTYVGFPCPHEPKAFMFAMV